MSFNSWKPLPAWCQRFTRLSLQVLLRGAGLTIMSAVLVAVLVQDPQSMNVKLWLDSARFPLLAWRLTLYATLALS